MTKGIVYVLTNPCLEGWVKIGMTSSNDIAKRLRDLNSPPNIPLSFRAYALYYVENPEQVEKDIHELIDMIDDSLHARETLASGRVREREFFQISPEKAYLIIKKVAKFRGDSANLKLVAATQEEQDEEEIISKRKRFSFKMLDIPIGSELVFIRDENETCTVIDDVNSVLYKGNTTTLSALAAQLLGWVSAQGPAYFTYNGEALTDIRAHKEASGNI